MITTRAVSPADRAAWLRMRCALWPDGTEAEHEEEIETFFAGTFPRGPWVVHLAIDSEQRALGFAEASVRSYAEGCVSNRVGYLEGWYVEADTRQQGVGRALVQSVEEWAQSMDCTEFASDAEPDNAASCAAHKAIGFEDAGLVRCFFKRLG